MTTLKIIISTGNAQSDAIFKGVFGSLDEKGTFQIAPELKGIHLFNLLTPEALAQQGIDLSSNLASIEIDEKNDAAVKATLMNVLRGSWLQTYDQVALPPGIAKAALDSERAGVDKAIQAAIDGTNLPRLDVQVESLFVNHPSTYTDSYDDEGSDDGSDQITLSADTIGRNCQWKLSSSPVDPTTAQATISSSNTLNDYATGQVVGDMTIYAGDLGEARAVLEAVNQAAAKLGGHHQFVREPKITTAEWHPYTPTPVATDTPVDTAEGAIDLAPAPGA